MKHARILVPIDFSSCSVSALDIAESLARQLGARLIMLYVEDAIIPYDDQEDELLEPFDIINRGHLTHIQLNDPDVAVERVAVFGDPADEIVQLARQRNVALIVMGTHGRTGIRRLLTGSVASDVMQRAECPVLAVRDKATAVVQPDTTSRD